MTLDYIDILDIFMVALATSAVFCLALGIIESKPEIISDYVDTGDFLDHKYDVVSKISCGSDSMGLSFKCSDVVYSRKVLINETMIPGEVYIYTDPDPNKTNKIIHRLAVCLDENCSRMVFRGDNNAVGEIVNRSQIYAKPVLQLYE